MLAIIAHHYVVNSTVMEKFTYDHPGQNQLFLEVWGMWGKTAINSFIVISGYFMCRMHMRWQRWVKLLIQIWFYSFVIMFIFALTGYEAPSARGIIYRLTFFLGGVNNGFTGSFMVFYAFVPVYNRVLEHLNRRELMYLVVGLLTAMCISGTFFRAPSMNEPVWYMTLYFVAAYIRNYPERIKKSLGFWIVMLLAGIVLAIASVLCIRILPTLFGIQLGVSPYYFVEDSNKFLAFWVGLSSFMVALNVKPFTNKFINWLSAGTFAVLLIHASSDTMRRWLWQDVVNVPGMFEANFPDLLIQALLVPPIIFAVCATIDGIYRRWLERPLMRRLKRIGSRTKKA